MLSGGAEEGLRPELGASSPVTKLLPLRLLICIRVFAYRLGFQAGASLPRAPAALRHQGRAEVRSVAVIIT